MSKRAEEAAFKAYPDYPSMDGGYITQRKQRHCYIKGYEKAEKDIISIIESLLPDLLGDAQPTPILRYELQDLIKKIKEEE